MNVDLTNIDIYQLANFLNISFEDISINEGNISIKDVSDEDLEIKIKSFLDFIETGRLNHVRNHAIQVIKDRTSSNIKIKVPLFKQMNIGMGIYDEEKSKELKDIIQSEINKVSDLEEKINKETNIDKIYELIRGPVIHIVAIKEEETEQQEKVEKPKKQRKPRKPRKSKDVKETESSS